MEIILIIILALVVFAIIIAPAKYPKDNNAKLINKETKKPVPIAHRGLFNNGDYVFPKNLKTGPENSLPAFSAAMQYGVGVELDLQTTKDGQVIVFHDDTMQRVCGVDKTPQELTWEEIQKLRLFNTKCKIPLFQEVLDLIDGKQTIVVELKFQKNWKELCQKAAPLLENYKGAYCVESFHPSIVKWFYKNYPKTVRGQLATNPKNAPNIFVGFLLSCLFSNIVTSPHFVAYNYKYIKHNFSLWLYKKMGGKLVAWTVKTPDEYKKYEKYYDCIIFEDPKTPSDYSTLIENSSKTPSPKKSKNNQD